MPLYMYEVAYTPQPLAAQITHPQDRLEAFRPGFEAMGVKILLGGYPLGEYDVLIIVEAADDATAASVPLAVTAKGAVKSSKTTRLLSSQERIESLRKAQDVPYQPARQGADGSQQAGDDNRMP
jgi:uncharacterized protein with GYD domain